MDTYDTGLDGYVVCDDGAVDDKCCRHDSHGYEGELPLDGQSHGVRRDEEGETLCKSVQFLGNALIDTIAI